jgi:hypothetical protein
MACTREIVADLISLIEQGADPTELKKELSLFHEYLEQDPKQKHGIDYCEGRPALEECQVRPIGAGKGTEGRWSDFGGENSDDSD